MTDTSKSFLQVNNIEVIYDHVILVLKGVSLEVPEGGIVALLGGNGAGKTTTLKAISNLLKSERGDVTKGSIEFKGDRTDKLTPSELVQMGVVQVMEGRRVFSEMSVDDNLRTGAITNPSSTDSRAAYDRVMELFLQQVTKRGATLIVATHGGGVGLPTPRECLAMLGCDGVSDAIPSGDADGWIYFAGRGFDWLRVDGENFAAAPVERILTRHPGIALAASSRPIWYGRCASPSSRSSGTPSKPIAWRPFCMPSTNAFVPSSGLAPVGP